MLKHGKEALLIAFITGAFGALTVLLKDKGTAISIILFIVTLAIVYFIIWKSMQRIKEAVGDPRSHPVFYTIDSGLKNTFDYLPIPHKKKKQLVVKYLKIKFKLIRNALTGTIEDKSIQSLPIRITEAVAETRMQLAGMAPQAFVDKMAEWDNKHTAWTMNAMYPIIDSSFYNDQGLKYSACFDCVQVMVKSTFVAIENAISELNGDLETYLDGRKDE